MHKSSKDVDMSRLMQQGCRVTHQWCPVTVGGRAPSYLVRALYLCLHAHADDAFDGP